MCSFKKGEAVCFADPTRQLAVQLVGGGEEEVVRPAARIRLGGVHHARGVQPAGQPERQQDGGLRRLAARVGDKREAVAVGEGDLRLLHLDFRLGKARKNAALHRPVERVFLGPPVKKHQNVNIHSAQSFPLYGLIVTENAADGKSFSEHKNPLRLPGGDSRSLIQKIPNIAEKA